MLEIKGGKIEVIKREVMKQFKFLEETYRNSGNHSAPKNLLYGMNLIDAFNPPF